MSMLTQLQKKEATPLPHREGKEAIGRADDTESGRRTAARVRILTYNIMLGERWPQVRDLLLAHPADVVCLQEVPEEQYASREPVVRPSQIGQSLGLAHELVLLWDRRPRRIGNMTLVRGRLHPGRVLTTRVSQPYGCSHEVEVDGARFTVVNVHMTPMLGPPPIFFSVSEMIRVREALDLTRRYESRNGPVIAAGDFNTFWPAPACWVMRRAWRDSRVVFGGHLRATRPTYGLPFVIDFVFLRGEVAVLDHRVLDGTGSDHRAVMTTLAIPRSA